MNCLICDKPFYGSTILENCCGIENYRESEMHRPMLTAYTEEAVLFFILNDLHLLKNYFIGLARLPLELELMLKLS